MVAAFRRHGLGQILDFVPNHMGVGGADNPLWLDVLEWGPDSEYAGWFDIDWDPDRRYLQGKLLVPVLGDQYGAVLEVRQLTLQLRPGGRQLRGLGLRHAQAADLPAALCARSSATSTRSWSGWATLSPACRLAPAGARRAPKTQGRARRARRGKPDDVRPRSSAAVGRFNGKPGELETLARLDALIQDQHWRAAHFRVAADDINYRRFFNINDLAGLRMELPELFDHAHRLVFDLLDDGVLDGLRIDHIDGLLDPKGLSACGCASRRRGRSISSSRRSWRAHEALREDWPVEGTTGYDFTNLAARPAGRSRGEERASRSSIASFTGETAPFATSCATCKLRIMENEMASELNVLARDAARVARAEPAHRRLHPHVLQRALQADRRLLPGLPHLCRRHGAPTDADRRDIDWAVAQARRNDPALDPSVFDFLHQLADRRSGRRAAQRLQPRRGRARFAMRVQQYSGPVMAKGLEDTAFYRYNRFVALNEVGGDPDRFGVSRRRLPQRQCASAPQHWPHAMLGTSTHDTKRGEDTRARLAVLSEMPEEWARQVADLEPACCAPAAATSRAPRRPIATTNTCSTSCWSAPGRPICRREQLPAAAADSGLCRAHRRRDDEVHARGQAAYDLGVRRTRL